MTEVINFALTPLKETTKVFVIDLITDEPHKTEKGDDMFVEVYSADSKRYKKIMADIQREYINKKNKNVDYNALAIEKIASLIANWNIEIGGTKLELNKTNAIGFLTANPKAFEDIDAAIVDRKNFLPNQ